MLKHPRDFNLVRELMAKRWQVTREAQNQLAYESHRRAAAACDDGFSGNLVVEFQRLREDNNLRRDTSVERLAQLEPAFPMEGSGTLTAVDFVKDEGLLMAPAYAVPRMPQDAGMGLKDFDWYEIHEAFAAQVPCTLKAWESPEFCRERLGLAEPLGSIDRARLNVKGGSLAMGHPFAATGARILATLAKLLDERGGGRGLISICTAGGMGVTAIVEKK